MEPTAAAEALGAQHGRERATWTFDGNTDQATYERCLALAKDGDPAWDDSFGAPSPLSGQWAGDPGPADILATLDSSDEELLPVYEQAYFDAYHDAVLATAQRMVQP